MITRLVSFSRKRKSKKIIFDILESKCVKIAVRAYINETGKLLLNMLSSNGNIIEHLYYNLDYSKFDNLNNHYKHVYIIPNVEARFTNNVDVVLNQTGISSFTIVKDNYTKRKGSVIYV